MPGRDDSIATSFSKVLVPVIRRTGGRGLLSRHMEDIARRLQEVIMLQGLSHDSTIGDRNPRQLPGFFTLAINRFILLNDVKSIKIQGD